MVQWQDGPGEWHDVEGWRGEVEERWVTWWVAPADFDTGPFRWVVYRGAGGNVWGISESFDLPANHGHLARVPVSQFPNQ